MRRLPAYPVYLAFCTVSWIGQLMAYGLLSVYYLTVAGLSPFQLALVGAVLQVTILLGEVPTGVIADVYSRRLSVVLGTLLMGAGFALEGLVPRLDAILAAQVIRGLGQTFLSGAATAWVTDELGEARAPAALLRGAQFSQAGGLAGNLLAALLAQVSVGLPILAGGLVVLGLGLWLAVVMPEAGFRPAPRAARAAWESLGRTLAEGLRVIRGRPVLLSLLAAGLFIGASGAGVDRFWEAHFLRNYTFPALAGLQPVIWFSLFNLGAMALSAAAIGWVTHRLGRGQTFSVERLLPGLHVLSGAALVVLGAAGGFGLALAAFWGGVLFASAAQPLAEIWLNRHLSSAVRATGLSLHSQVRALGELGGGLLLGVLAAQVSLRAVMAAAGLLLLPAALLLWGAGRLTPAPAEA